MHLEGTNGLWPINTNNDEEWKMIKKSDTVKIDRRIFL